MESRAASDTASLIPPPTPAADPPPKWSGHPRDQGKTSLRPWGTALPTRLALFQVVIRPVKVERAASELAGPPASRAPSSNQAPDFPQGEPDPPTPVSQEAAGSPCRISGENDISLPKEASDLGPHSSVLVTLCSHPYGPILSPKSAQPSKLDGHSCLAQRKEKPGKGELVIKA